MRDDGDLRGLWHHSSKMVHRLPVTVAWVTGYGL
jgi:hypothetical protein